jgi:Asp/Glu/hydantoin racemase
MADAGELVRALADICDLAVAADGAEAIIVGGGPLAAAGRTLRQRGFTAPIIEPLPSAVRLALARRLRSC